MVDELTIKYYLNCHLLLASKTSVDLICATDFGFDKMHL